MVETPIVFSAMSFGAISYNAFLSLATAASKLGTYFNTGGEGGLPREMREKFGKHAIVQVASGSFRHRCRIPQLRRCGGDQGGPGG